MFSSGKRATSGDVDGVGEEVMDGSEPPDVVAVAVAEMDAVAERVADGDAVTEPVLDTDAVLEPVIDMDAVSEGYASEATYGGSATPMKYCAARGSQADECGGAGV
jgi:hypothetical protein